MSSSLTLERVTLTSREAPRSFSGSISRDERVLTPRGRSKEMLLRYTKAGLDSLAKRQGATDLTSYAYVLRLVSALIRDNSPTPQVGDNGENGIAVEWLVDGNVLRIDYEDETEILVAATNSAGESVFCEALSAWWLETNPVISDARRFLSKLSSAVANPISIL